MLYRVLKALDTGHRPGDVVDGGRFKHLARLQECGCLTPVSAPPLHVLPGWSTRWQCLPAEWQTVEAMIAAPTALLAAAAGVNEATAGLWQAEALDFLRPTKCKNCKE